MQDKSTVINLYVAEVNRILRYDNIENRLRTRPEPVIVNDDFPKDKHHGWKYIAFGPDDMLYVPVGAPCNVCDAPGYALILRMNPDGSNQRPLFPAGTLDGVELQYYNVGERALSWR